MIFPGRLIRIGEQDGTVIDAIVTRLAEQGYRLETPPNGYDRTLASLVKLFQSQHLDADGRPLLADGVVGPLSWGALFGATAIVAAGDGIASAALAVAISQIGQMEDPVGSNRGPMVDRYLASVGLDPGLFWCMAFVHFCFQTAAADRGIPSPFPKTGGCLDAWNRVKRNAPGRIVTKAEGIADPARIKPGLVFILDHGGGLGHTGFVRSIIGGALHTVEGNSNPDGSRNGIGVFDIKRRKITDAELKGFLDFTRH
ncbi:MAG: CHAP domain-containing protein [Sphingomonas sp.]|nr:CHAP domain-containing protein [Sphingomonas sp.]